MKSFTAIALENFPLVKPGDDIAKITVEIAKETKISIEDGDIIAVAQKIFSKSENRIAKLRDVAPSRKAEKIAQTTCKNSKFVELVLSETEKVVKATQEILIVKDKRNLVCINAGIDKSNVRGSDSFTLLPYQPDVSAQKFRSKIRELTGKNIAVVICDTYSRPLRRGQVNFAIGIAGIRPFKDYRGKRDLFGLLLKVKNVAVVDEIASAAELIMGQAEEGRPVVIIRGLQDSVEFSEDSSIEELQISEEEDLFRNVL